MTTTSAISKTLGMDLRAGMIIRDDIACRIVSVVPEYLGEVFVSVEDGNGYFYSMRLDSHTAYSTYNWSSEDWDMYRAL